MIFKYFKEKKAKKLENIRIIRNEIKTLNDKCRDIASEDNVLLLTYAEKSNSVCPKCSSKNVINKISRIQGSSNGSISGYSTLFYGELYGSSSGKIDTNEVNHCKDCDHEWQKSTNTYRYSKDILGSKIRNVKYYLENYNKYINCEYDASDLNEKYNSLEEKKLALYKEWKESYVAERIKEFWAGISIETFLEVVKIEGSTYDIDDVNNYYNKEILLEIGFTTLN